MINDDTKNLAANCKEAAHRKKPRTRRRSIVRAPWPPNFPPVYVHTAWEAPDAAGSALPDHSSYWPAKKRRDFQAALKVCHDLVREDALNLVFDACQGNPPSPIVAVPALSLFETQNALAIGYGKWLANEMGWEVSETTFQGKVVNRDFTTDGWFRLVQQPEFYGEIEPGRRYILADDVCTMGGTLASLRGFIYSKGGEVTCTTALASKNGSHVPISLAEDTLARLTDAHGGELAAICQMELGYEVACLTEAEGQFLLRCPSIDALRAGIDGARYT